MPGGAKLVAALALSVGLGAVSGLVGCFDGATTLGGACESNAQCGDDQSCSNGVCGRCGDGKAQVGEVCFGSATERALGGVPSTMAVIPTSDGDDVVLIAVNGACRDFDPNELPGDCWQIVQVGINANGELGLETTTSARGQIGEVAPGDFDGDGSLDVAATVLLDNLLTVAFSGLEDEDGEFVNILLPDAAPSTIYVADLDGDGADDMVVGPNPDPDQATQAASVIMSNGDRTFRAPVSYPAGAYVRVAPPIDTDNDGVPDLVLTGIADDGVSAFIAVLRGVGDGTFEGASINVIGVAVLPFGTAVGDLDDDGNADLAVTLLTGGQGRLAVAFGDGQGGFGSPRLYDAGLSPTAVSLRDINGDDKLDALVANSEDDKVSFYLNDLLGDGGFGPQQQLDVSFGPVDIAAARLDDDAFEELIVTNVNGTVSVSRSDP